MKDQTDSRVMARIRRSIAYLLMPRLETLQEELSLRKSELSEQRNSLEARRLEIRDEGYEAAMRLMHPSMEQGVENSQSYFKQIEDYRERRS